MTDDCRCAKSYFSNKPQLKLQDETTHKSTFKAYPIAKQPQLQAPKVVQKHYDPDVLKSSYKSTYTKPAQNAFPDQIDSISQHFNNKPKNVPFYSDTSYKQSYPKYDVKPEKQPTYQYKPKDTKFQGQSSYKAQYKPKQNPDLASQEMTSVKDYMSRKAKVPFEGCSAYKDTFKDHGVVREKQPEYKYQPKDTKFQGSSSYKDTFKPLPKEAYGNGIEHCPVHPEKVAIK